MIRCEIVNYSVECITQPVEDHVEQDLDDKNYGANYIHSEQEASDHDDEATSNENKSATNEQRETVENQATLEPKSAQEEEQDLDVQKENIVVNNKSQDPVAANQKKASAKHISQSKASSKADSSTRLSSSSSSSTSTASHQMVEKSVPEKRTSDNTEVKESNKKAKKYTAIDEKIERLMSADKTAISLLKINSMTIKEYRAVDLDLGNRDQYQPVRYENMDDEVEVFQSFCNLANTLTKKEAKIKVLKNLTYLHFFQYLDKAYGHDADGIKEYRMRLKEIYDAALVDRFFSCAKRIKALYGLFHESAIRCTYLFNSTLLGDAINSVFESVFSELEAHKGDLEKAFRF